MTLLIKNGLVIDPKNKVYSKMNVFIKDNKIKDLTLSEPEADIVIEAEGKVVCPGFVDMHMHEDPYIMEEDRIDFSIFNCMVKMGVTTAIGGNCGIGPKDEKTYLDTVDIYGTPVNVGLMIPHENLRKTVNIIDKYKNVLDEKKLRDMKYYAQEKLGFGLLGVSFGIRYIPGITEKELLIVSESVKEENKLVSAHIRDDAQQVITATQEFVNVGKQLGIKIQNSHIGSMGAYGQMEELLQLMDLYRMNGVDIGWDCYPYSAFSTSIGETTYNDGFLDRYQTTYNSIEIAEGQYKGIRLNKQLFEKIRKENPKTITIAHVMNQNEIDMALQHPNTIVASDGLMHNLQGHPRGSGTFPKVIHDYINHKANINLYDIINKMTAMPADRLGIKKGSIGIGCDADIVIFDLNAIESQSTFKEPFLPPKGISHVIINGEIAVEDNQLLKNNLGRSVRK